jgi:transposase
MDINAYNEPMYVDIVPNRNSPPAVLLRESIREGRKIRKQTLANLSQWDPTRVELLRRLLRGELDRQLLGEAVSGPVFGVLFSLKKVAADLGIPQALGQERMGKLGLFLILARGAHQGSRLSAVRWGRDQAVAEVLGVSDFDEEDLYATLDDLAERQSQIEKRLYQRYVQRRGSAPVLFLYDVTSSYLEGEHNELAEYGYNRDGQAGKKQIVVGLLTDAEGEPMSVRVFAGNTADPTTLPEQIEILKRQFAVAEVVFVGDRGMIKSSGKEQLTAQGMRYITALTNPQIRKLLKRGVLQLGLFEEKICEVEAEGKRYILRKNPAEARKDWHRVQDKLQKLQQKVQARNQQVLGSPRCQPEAGLHQLQQWSQRHKLSSFISLTLEERTLTVRLDEAAQQQALDLAGCYVIETDVPKPLLAAQTAHDRYKDLTQVERDIRTLKTGLLEVRPIFLRKERRTRGHVLVCMLALKLSREIQRRLAAVFGTTDSDPHAVTLPDALAALNRLCLLHYPIDEHRSLTRLPKPDAHQAQILNALKVHLPSSPL